MNTEIQSKFAAAAREPDPMKKALLYAEAREALNDPIPVSLEQAAAEPEPRRRAFLFKNAREWQAKYGSAPMNSTMAIQVNSGSAEASFRTKQQTENEFSELSTPEAIFTALWNKCRDRAAMAAVNAKRSICEKIDVLKEYFGSPQ